MQWAEHNRILTVRESDNDLVTYNRRIFGMFDAEYFTAAAMNRERCERSAFQVKPNLLKHPQK